jgi:hypothetical protein
MHGNTKGSLGQALLRASVVDTHAPSVILLQNQDWVRQPVWVEHFHDEAGCEEPADLFTDGLPFLLYKAPQRLLDRLGIRPDMK